MGLLSMNRLIAALASLAFVLSLGMAPVACAMASPACAVVGVDDDQPAYVVSGGSDEAPTGTPKGCRHCHCACHGHHVAVPAEEAAKPGFVQGSACPDAIRIAMPIGAPGDPALRPPQA
jgi:anaerobic selenocysteine-containing dehydrogenase